MHASRPAIAQRIACRAYSSLQGFQPVPTLPNLDIETFREHAFEPALPAILPRGCFGDIPAIERWFARRAHGLGLNAPYLAQYSSTIVPLEISSEDDFARVEQSLGFFLEASDLPTSSSRIYLAQATIAGLAEGLRKDVPTPDLVLKAGKGDVYDSSIWLGRAPTYTPLHRDPNPNLFVQLAGSKRVRLFKSSVGQGIFARVQERIGGHASATMRGEEMMHGVEKRELEREVWDDEVEDGSRAVGLEAELNAGDGLFIPKGWWHSIKGVGEGMTGSVWTI